MIISELVDTSITSSLEVAMFGELVGVVVASASGKIMGSKFICAKGDEPSFGEVKMN